MTGTPAPPLPAAFADSGEDAVRAALAAVLGLHRPVPGRWGTSCTCWAPGGSHRAWPCPEILAIIRAAEGSSA